MKLTILGSATSMGVPQIGCNCPVCTSTDPRDRRLRCSALLEVDGRRILIDCGPDFREQILKLPFAPLDAILITHEHYDHVGGLDDLRTFCKVGNTTLDIYAKEDCANHIRQRLPYCFKSKEEHYIGAPSFNLIHVVPHNPFRIGDTVEIMPIKIMHADLPIIGFRIRNLVYITDMKTIPEEELPLVNEPDVLIVNALHHETHWSHQNFAEAIKFSQQIHAHETYLIHVSHRISHEKDDAKLPPHVHIAYDGLEINIP